MAFKRTTWALAELCLAWLLLFGAMAGCGNAAYAQSAPATTPITETVYRADGTAAAGTVLISWPAFSTGAGDSVPAGSTSVTIGANGALNVSLVANAGSTPMGSYYTVLYHLADGTETREYWVVPVSTAPIAVSTIRSTVLPASVAMQTVSKSYVDTQIAKAQVGIPLDSPTTPYVLKAGDTMTGPLLLPGDPTAPQQASDKNYVDEQVAGLTTGLSQKVSLFPQATQTVVQPAGTQLAVNTLNGVEDASQYVSGAGNNGIANATSSAVCGSGCDVQVEQQYPSTELAAPATWSNQTHVDDRRGGASTESFTNPLPPQGSGFNAARTINVTSTQTAQSVLAETGGGAYPVGLQINSEALAGGSNVFPAQIQGTVPYFKTTYSGLVINGDNKTIGQHVLQVENQNCYAVGDCLMGGMFMKSSGGFRDDSDEGAHPFDRSFTEDTEVFTGSCTAGCTTGSTSVQVTASTSPGTQGEGRYLIDTNPARAITTGALVGGLGFNTGRQPSATFTGTSFPVSTFLETAQTIPTQSNSINPGTVSVLIATSAVPPGFSISTAALPAGSGVACVSDVQVLDGRPLNFETAAYTVLDNSHLQMTLVRPHAAGATVAVGGLCGYGLEQKVDTLNGIRQVFPVIGSTSATSLLYAGGTTSLVGQQGLSSGYVNVSLVVASIARSGNVVTVTTAVNPPEDFSGLTLTVQGVTDSSYNGSFVVSATGPNTLTYADNGPDSSSTGGTLSLLTGAYGLYPMAEVESVFNPATRAVDGLMTLAANTVPWAAGDTVELPHYFQQNVHDDTDVITQYTPRPTVYQSAGVEYDGNNSGGLVGWQINNGDPASSYFGNGGTHIAPAIGLELTGIWNHSADLQAGENTAFAMHCNSHGCGKWNSTYNLFALDSLAGQDTIRYAPATSTMDFYMGGSDYRFAPTGLTANTINVTTLNAGSVHGLFQGSVAATSLPVFAGSGAGHQVGAVPDPGATAGATRFLREDGAWAAPPSGGTATATLGYLDGSGSNSAGVGGEVITVIDAGASSLAGTVTQIKATIASFTAGSGQLSAAVFQNTGGNSYQIVQRVALTVTGAGVQTWNAGTDFTAMPIAAGEFFGYITTPNAIVEFGGNNPTSAITYFTFTDPGTSATSYANGGTQSVQATVTASSSSSSVAAALASGTVAVPMAASSPYRGLRLGVWGHSLATPGFEYSGVTLGGVTYTYWQQALCAQLGCTWTFNNGVPGSGYSNAFNNYGAIAVGGNQTSGSPVLTGLFAVQGQPLAGLTVGMSCTGFGSATLTLSAIDLAAGTLTFSGNATGTSPNYNITCGTRVSPATVTSALSLGMAGGVSGAAMTSGTTLVQDLANVDILLVWYGDNDWGVHGTGITGTPGDALSANSSYGDLDNFLASVFTANPGIRVMLLDHGYAGRSFGLAGYQAIRSWEQTAGQSYGVGVMDLLSLSGLNPLTWNTWLNSDELHPTNAGWAHLVPILARNLNAY